MTAKDRHSTARWAAFYTTGWCDCGLYKCVRLIGNDGSTRYVGLIYFEKNFEVVS